MSNVAIGAHESFQETWYAMPIGDEYIYYTGYSLIEARRQRTPEGKRLNNLAALLWSYSEQRFAALVQRRLPDGMTEYIAIKLR